jgi:hypothetical protein
VHSKGIAVAMLVSYDTAAIHTAQFMVNGHCSTATTALHAATAAATA